MSTRRRHHRVSLALAMLAMMAMAGVAPPPSRALAATTAVRADLDGKAIDPTRVGDYFCHDFDVPRIHCFRTAVALEGAVSPLSTSSVNYVLIFENISYGGNFMFLSQDYSVLAWIGWNDRISSFKVQNGQSGRFWGDWLWSGSAYAFCCNSQVSSLGGYNDTFSSVQHN